MTRTTKGGDDGQKAGTTLRINGTKVADGEVTLFPSGFMKVYADMWSTGAKTAWGAYFDLMKTAGPFANPALRPMIDQQQEAANAMVDMTADMFRSVGR